MQYNKTKQELINEVLDNFDFEKVHKVMTFLDWKWFSYSESTMEVPSIAKLVRTAQQYLEMAYDGLEKIEHNEHSYMVGSGGFEAQAKRYPAGLDKPDVLLTLTFNLASFEAATYDR